MCDVPPSSRAMLSLRLQYGAHEMKVIFIAMICG